MRRKKTSGQRAHRGYDFLEEVHPRRLQLIGAITLAWNWIEGAIDTSLAISLETHPDMWTEVTSRINGMDGKLELLRKCLSLTGYPPPPPDSEMLVRNAIGAVATYKRLRDGIIHARLIDPKSVIADTSQRRGVTDEVLLSEEALQRLYDRLSLLVREIDMMVLFYFYRWKISEEPIETQRMQLAREFLVSATQFGDLQRTREALPPLPEFPPDDVGQLPGR